MKDYSTIAKLYYLLIHADGKVNEKEIALGKKMVVIEEFDNTLFENELQKLNNAKKDILFKECVVGLKNLPKKKQIDYIAWMCLIANSDGFMDKVEWDLIYQLYKKSLNLDLDEIMARQRELNQSINSKLRVA
ncbi:MAG: hypothetical protein ACNS60_08490 [Candidatus Cyclobacteriaceae bacterium M2_1C_046]